MVYFLGVLMGYLIGVNTIVEKQITKNFGEMYVNKTIGFLSSIGGLGGWFCILPAAYFVGADYRNGFLNGAYLILSYLFGAFISGMLQVYDLNRSLSPFTLPINIALAVTIYHLT